MEWCGDDCLALAWSSGRVLLVGPTGDYLSYMYEGALLLLTEVDGISVYSSSSLDFIQKIPGMRSLISMSSPALFAKSSSTPLNSTEASLAVFRPASTKPAAILLEALEHFERKSPKADENIRNLRADLPEAVDTCIEAAGLERQTSWQKKLLKVRSKQIFPFEEH